MTRTDFGIDDNLMAHPGTHVDFAGVIELTGAMALQDMSGNLNAALGVAPQVVSDAF